jgi:hypothetical protein
MPGNFYRNKRRGNEVRYDIIARRRKRAQNEKRRKQGASLFGGTKPRRHFPKRRGAYNARRT